MSSRARPIVRAALACLALGGCAPASRARTTRVPVTIAAAERRDVPFAIGATGTVEAIQRAAVGSQVGGVVVRIAFHEGDYVQAGQVLFQLDPRPFRATLDQVQAATSRDRAQAESARLESERARALFERALLSQAEWDQKRAAAEAWSATVRADSASVMKAALDLEYASIRAPVSGRTGRLLTREGDYVRAATAEPLVTINQARPVRVAFPVPASAAPMVQRYRGTRPSVLIRAADADSSAIEGHLVFVDNALDPASGTLLLKAEFPNRDDRLTPGQFVDVRLILYVEPGATVVPAPAVTRGQEGAFVYVMNADSTVSPRPVQVSRTEDELAVISAGLRPGERVVTDGQLRLSPGAKVMVRDAPGVGP